MNAELIHLTGHDCSQSCLDAGSLAIFKEQSILVTGGTGFLGKWIAEMIMYLNNKYQYRIKLFLLGRDIERFRQEVPHIAKEKLIFLLELDVRNLHEIPDEINWVIHAAGSPDSRDHASQPLRTVETFYKGTNAVLDACFRLPDLKKLLHISSHQVYGHINVERIKENEMGVAVCNSVNAAYMEAKRMAETLCAIYRNQQKLPIVIARPFAFVGPYQKADKPWAINNFIRDGLLGGPIRILGNGETTRSYLYGSDMAYWLLQMLAFGVVGETYNLGSNEGVSLKELAYKISQLMDGRIEIISKSSKEVYNSVSKAVADTTKVASSLCVKEVFNIDLALSRTIQWNLLMNNSQTKTW